MRVLFQGDSITDCGRHREAVEPNIGLGAGYAMLSAGRLLADHPRKKYSGVQPCELAVIGL